MEQGHLTLPAGHSSSYSQKDIAIISALNILEINMKIIGLKNHEKPGNDKRFFFFSFFSNTYSF